MCNCFSFATICKNWICNNWKLEGKLAIDYTLLCSFFPTDLYCNDKQCLLSTLTMRMALPISLLSWMNHFFLLLFWHHVVLSVILLHFVCNFVYFVINNKQASWSSVYSIHSDWWTLDDAKWSVIE